MVRGVTKRIYINGSFFRVNDWWSPSSKPKDFPWISTFGRFAGSAFEILTGSVRYFLQEESPIWAQVASEAFRDSTFGMIDVRILESGRRRFVMFSANTCIRVWQSWQPCFRVSKMQKSKWKQPFKDSMRAGVSSTREKYEANNFFSHSHGFCLRFKCTHKTQAKEYLVMMQNYGTIIFFVSVWCSVAACNRYVQKRISSKVYQAANKELALVKSCLLNLAFKKKRDYYMYIIWMNMNMNMNINLNMNMCFFWEYAFIILYLYPHVCFLPYNNREPLMCLANGARSFPCQTKVSSAFQEEMALWVWSWAIGCWIRRVAASWKDPNTQGNPSCPPPKLPPPRNKALLRVY